MLIKAIIMLLCYFFWGLNSEKITYCPEHNYIINKQMNIAKPKLLETNEKKDLIATISINKINLINKPLYKINSTYNDISKNIQVLKESNFPDNDNSIIFLAAHSGLGPQAYFKNLYKLSINDCIELNYNNIKYRYTVSNIYEEDKKGFININKNKTNILILTTCSENIGKQLIIEAILTNKEDTN